MFCRLRVELLYVCFESFLVKTIHGHIFQLFQFCFFFLFNSKGREAPRGWSSISILPWHPHHEHFLYDTLILFLSSKLNYSDCTLRKLTLFKIMFQANQCTLSMRFNQV